MPTIKIILQWLGAIFLLLLLGFLSMAIFAFFQPERTGKASAKDVEFVLNWGGIAKDQPYTVVYSYESPPSFNGDHVIYHCIQLSSFTVNPQHRSSWIAGPERNPLIAEVIDSAATAGKINQCFSKDARPNTKDVIAYVWSIHLLGRSQIEGLQVLLYEPATKRLLYTSYET